MTINYDDITDKNLLDEFVCIQKNGQAASVYKNTKVVWSYIVPDNMSNLQMHDLFAHLSYAMLAATYDEDKRVVPLLQILVEPEGAAPVLIDHKMWDVWHPTVNKIREHFLKDR